jgi:hypothetical protein
MNHPQRVGRSVTPLSKPRGREQNGVVRGTRCIQAAVMRADAVPQGSVVSEPWPTHTSRPRQSTGKEGTTCTKREANRQDTQRRRARSDDEREATRRTHRRPETVCTSNATGSGKPSEPPRRTEKPSDKRNTRQSTRASTRSRPLDGCHAESLSARSRKNTPTRVRRASVPGKNASRNESNAVCGMRTCNGSEWPDRVARRNGQHALLSAPGLPISVAHESAASARSR